MNVLNLGVMDNTPASRAMRGMFLVFAQFERDMIVERTREGKKIASQRPDYKEGRKPTEYDRNLFTFSMIRWRSAFSRSRTLLSSLA